MSIQVGDLKVFTSVILESNGVVKRVLNVFVWCCCVQSQVSCAEHARRPHLLFLNHTVGNLEILEPSPITAMNLSIGESFRVTLRAFSVNGGPAAGKVGDLVAAGNSHTPDGPVFGVSFLYGTIRFRSWSNIFRG